jgi:hypothetical protein
VAPIANAKKLRKAITLKFDNVFLIFELRAMG